MSELIPRKATSGAPGALATIGVAAHDVVRYGTLLIRLAAAGVALRRMGHVADETFRYIEDCAASVDRLADQAAALNVDPATIGEHRDAAAVMRAALAEATAMAAECEEMGTLFDQAKAAHEADYGSVAEAANAMPVDMADRTFYSSR